MADNIIDRWRPTIAGKLFPNNRVDYLIDGPATYRSMFDTIQTVFTGDAGGYYIYLLGWWLDYEMPLVPEDKQSSLWPLLQKAAARNVQIRVVLWDNLLESLYKGVYGGASGADQVRAINTLQGAAAVIDGTHAVPFQAHHQKVLIVRGNGVVAGFCGGLDIAWDRIKTQAQHSGSPMHDVHCRIQGPATRGLVDVFEQRWAANAGNLSVKSASALRCARDRFPGPSEEKGPGDAQIAILRTFSDASGHCAKEQSIRSSLEKMIPKAKRYIYVEDQYMTNLDCAALLGAALGHVQFIFFMIAPSELSDLPDVWRARRAFLQAVAAAAPPGKANNFRAFYKLGAKGYGVSPKRPLPFPQQGPEDWPMAEDLGPHCYVHSKVWIFDDEVALIGSANCNRRGWLFDSEVAAVIMDVPPLASRTSYAFAQQLRIALWSEHLGTTPEKVRDLKVGAELWASEGLRPYVVDAPDGPWVRYYRDRPEKSPLLVTDPDSATPEIRGADYKSAMDMIADLSIKALKTCGT